MNGPLIDRYKELMAMDNEDPNNLTVSERYELGILASFHEPNGDPHYDDLWDDINLVDALANISQLAAAELRNTMNYLDSVENLRNSENETERTNTDQES